MRIAVYTLTRDRLEYTQQSFSSLWEKAGYDYDHFVLDNGSQDGTREWLRKNGRRFRETTFWPVNRGISVGSNVLLNQIGSSYDLIIKMDNDCRIVTDNLVLTLAKLFRQNRPAALISPRVIGINRQPTRAFNDKFGPFTFGRTGIVGGLFHAMQAKIYSAYRYPEQLPLAWGQDDDFCDWVRRQDVRVGYLEELVVEHIDGTDGQAAKYPEYFQRKWAEEKI